MWAAGGRGQESGALSFPSSPPGPAWKYWDLENERQRRKPLKWKGSECQPVRIPTEERAKTQTSAARFPGAETRGDMRSQQERKSRWRLLPILLGCHSAGGLQRGKGLTVRAELWVQLLDPGALRPHIPPGSGPVTLHASHGYSQYQSEVRCPPTRWAGPWQWARSTADPGLA